MKEDKSKIKYPSIVVLFNYKWRFLAYEHFLGRVAGREEWNHVSEAAFKTKGLTAAILYDENWSINITFILYTQEYRRNSAHNRNKQWSICCLTNTVFNSLT